MPSHFTTIGFAELGTVNRFVELADRIVDAPHETMRAPGGDYARWSGQGGEQIWVQFTRTGDLLGMVPHFAGRASVRARLTRRVERPGSPLDGAFHAWADPGAGEDDGAYPFLFDAPDASLHAALKLPAVVTVQVAAFAHELNVFESEAAFTAFNAREKVPYASRSFIPAGLLPIGGDGPSEESLALFTGHVVAAEAKQNALTGGTYHWALVESLGGSFDVVVDPEVQPELPRAGAIVQGLFWLSGRIAA